jgi:hypothetical protein
VARSVTGLERPRLALAELRADARNCPGQITNHKLGLEPQHAIAKALQLALTTRIPTADGVMIRPVNLSDELLRRSQEVDDESVGDHHLAAKLNPEAPPTECTLPKELLAPGGALAHGVSAFSEERRACGAVGTICRHSDLMARVVAGRSSLGAGGLPRPSAGDARVNDEPRNTPRSLLGAARLVRLFAEPGHCAGPTACGIDESQPLRALDAKEPLHSRKMLAHALEIPDHGGATVHLTVRRWISHPRRRRIR